MTVNFWNIKMKQKLKRRACLWLCCTGNKYSVSLSVPKTVWNHSWHPYAMFIKFKKWFKFGYRILINRNMNKIYSTNYVKYLCQLIVFVMMASEIALHYVFGNSQMITHDKFLASRVVISYMLVYLVGLWSRWQCGSLAHNWLSIYLKRLRMSPFHASRTTP